MLLLSFAIGNQKFAVSLWKYLHNACPVKTSLNTNVTFTPQSPPSETRIWSDLCFRCRILVIFFFFLTKKAGHLRDYLHMWFSRSKRTQKERKNVHKSSVRKREQKKWSFISVVVFSSQTTSYVLVLRQWQKDRANIGTLVHPIKTLWTLCFDPFWKVSVFDISAVTLHLPNRCPELDDSDKKNMKTSQLLYYKNPSWQHLQCWITYFWPLIIQQTLTLTMTRLFRADPR